MKVTKRKMALLAAICTGLFCLIWKGKKRYRERRERMADRYFKPI